MRSGSLKISILLLAFAAVLQAQVGGSGTTNTIPIWTNTTTLGNSLLLQKNGNIGIGTKTPTAKLHIVGASTGVLALANNTSLSTTTIPIGLLGMSPAVNGLGVQGLSTSTDPASLGSGVFGEATGAGGNGVNGFATSACSSTLCPVGVHGTVLLGGAGVVAQALNTSGASNAVQAENSSPQGVGVAIAEYGSGIIIAGVSGPLPTPVLKFQVDGSGNAFFAGNLTKGGGSFKIDHPLDPANKYLSHSFVESPDMMNVYNGVAVMDSDGERYVELPEYFEALNSNFRYQLTAIGAPGPNLYIAEEVSHNRFKIAGGKAGSKVSWQVTGVRHDAYAQAHRIPVEEEKPAQERGHYLHPELFGATEKEAVGIGGQSISAPTIITSAGGGVN